MNGKSSATSTQTLNCSNNMPKYRLLRDLPQAKAGSKWDTNNTDPERAYMSCENGEGFSMLRKDMYLWFEEIKEMPKFTKEQAEAIMEQVGTIGSPERAMTLWSDRFKRWLDENTENV